DDFVWLENPSAGYALQTPLLGPFVVSGVDSRYKYRIRDLFSKEEIPVVHSNIRKICGEHSLEEMKLIRGMDCRSWPVEKVIDHKRERNTPYFLAVFLDGTEKWLSIDRVIGSIPLEHYLIEHNEALNDVIQFGVKHPRKKKPGRKKKKDDKWRLCIDYRQLNECIVDVAYPLPRISDLLTHLTGQYYFAALDLVHGYHQLPLHPDTRHITAFTTPLGLFEWTVLPFGLKSAPGIFQRTIQHLFSDLLYHGVLVYLDDIIVYGSTAEEFIERLTEVLKRICSFG
ncbi:hypothetical protein ADUPG1_011606, partial [Aduncisulcus paluster]